MAITHGARGLFLKTSLPEQWLKAVRTVGSGEFWFGRKLLTDLLGILLQKPEHEALPGPGAVVLTEREREVARWVGRGMSNKEISRQMTISDATVKTQFQHIFSKLKVDRSMLIAHQTIPSFFARLPLPY